MELTPPYFRLLFYVALGDGMLKDQKGENFTYPRPIPAPNSTAVVPIGINQIIMSVVADLPIDVTAMVLPYLDGALLTPVAQRAVTDQRRGRPMGMQ